MSEDYLLKFKEFFNILIVHRLSTLSEFVFLQENCFMNFFCTLFNLLNKCHNKETTQLKNFPNMDMDITKAQHFDCFVLRYLYMLFICGFKNLLNRMDIFIFIDIYC